jgi:bifunctional DNA-binding transcriptional regulator/antitoxin component of YhaV-PrlF toxin-antitoxin module
MAKNSLVTLDEEGGIVLPEAIRREMDLVAGDIFVARIESDRLVLEKPSAVLERLKARFAGLAPGVSLAEELIAERREEAAKESL